MNQPRHRASPRQLYMVLSARSLPYAEKAFESLFAHAIEPIALTLITDDASDKARIIAAMSAVPNPCQHAWAVFDKADADERSVTRLQGFSFLQQFREGHPCWRKLTDPMLFAEPGAEMIILDPDLYFPNHFNFEPTPESGIALMWQPPSCLLPEEVVRRAYDARIQLAHHVDIGVAQLRNTIDLAWFDNLIRQLGGASIPRVMHVEAIVWAAMAMQLGGRYLDAGYWHCWQHRQWKRVLLRLGVPGIRLLGLLDFSGIKCFHAGGIAKWWVKDAAERGLFKEPSVLAAARAGADFEELRPGDYDRDQRVKRLARSLGYYTLFKPAL